MHGWETRMLLKYYLEPGVSKAELSRRFGVSRRTIHEWVETGQLDRDLSSGGSRYAPRPAMPVWRQVLLPLNVNYSCRFGRLLVRRRTVRWALLRVLKTQKTKRRERPLGDVHGVR